MLRAVKVQTAMGFYLAMVPVMRLALAANFRRVRALRDHTLPRVGAVLVVANHPSTWTDVLLLDAVLGRRLHFLAKDDQFWPWPRKVLLRMFGALPLSSLEDRADAIARNAGTFRRCETLFDRGECVAIFPEGISQVDRGLLPLKHGAARLALSYAGQDGSRRPLTIVPVGIYYSDRRAFRSDVTVSVGEGIGTAELCGPGVGEPEQAARLLTERLTEAMRGHVVGIADRQHAMLFSVLEPLATANGEPLDLESARRLAKSLAELARKSPRDFARLERSARSFERMCLALDVRESALGERSRKRLATAMAAVLAGLVPALAGLAVHAAALALTRLATQHYASQPSRVAFARIASGSLFLSLTYGAEAAFLVGTDIPRLWILPLLLVSGLLGVVAIGWVRRARLECDRWRIARISRRHGRLVQRARRVRESLRAQVELLS